MVFEYVLNILLVVCGLVFLLLGVFGIEDLSSRSEIKIMEPKNKCVIFKCLDCKEVIAKIPIEGEGFVKAYTNECWLCGGEFIIENIDL